MATQEISALRSAEDHSSGYENSKPQGPCWEGFTQRHLMPSVNGHCARCGEQTVFEPSTDDQQLFDGLGLLS